MPRLVTPVGDLMRTLRSALARWRRCVVALCALWAALVAGQVAAHEFQMDAVITAFVRIEPGQATLVVRAPLYLFKSARFPLRNIEIDVPQSGAAIGRAVAGLGHDIVLFEDGRALASSKAEGRLSLPSDRSFATYEQALAHIAEPVERDTQIYIDQGYVDARFTYPIRSPNSVFAVRTIAGRDLGDYLKLALRYLPEKGESRAMVITSLSGTVELNPTWIGAASGFVGLGIAHILTGYDHLLFLLCLVVPLRGWRQVLSVITVFSIAHSLTLLGSAFDVTPGGAWFPPFVETAIAASIFYMALENIVGVKLDRRVWVTGLFGLVHGFGFSYGLRENFQFAGTHLVVSLLGFNVGIELGQILVLAVMLPALAALRRLVPRRRVAVIVVSAIVAHVAWHWMADRAATLWAVPWPRPGVADLATLALWLAAMLLLGAALASLGRRLWTSTALVGWRTRSKAFPQRVGAVGPDATPHA